MRRFASVFLCLLLLPVVALADGTRFPEDTWAVVSNPSAEDCLNLREHPWQDSASLGKYYNGTQVRLVAEYADSPDWVYVQVGQGAGSAEGFMMKRYLCMNPAEEAVLPVNPIRTLRGGSGAVQPALYGGSAGNPNAFACGRAGDRAGLYGQLPACIGRKPCGLSADGCGGRWTARNACAF